MGESTHMSTQEKNKNQSKPKGKGKGPVQAGIKKESKCFFYKRKRHMKKDCIKFKAWLEKKGILISHFCYKSNMIDVSSNT